MVLLKGKDIGIDFGTSRIRILTGKDEVFDEPSMALVDIVTRRSVATGEEAVTIKGKLPVEVIPVYPLKDGVIADLEVASDYVRTALRKIGYGKSIISPRAVAAVPVGITDIERQAMEDVLSSAGIRDVLLIESPVLAFLGAATHSYDHAMIVLDIGAEITQAAILFDGAVVRAKSINLGADDLDEAISDHLVAHENLLAARFDVTALREEILNFSGEGKEARIDGKSTRSTELRTATVRTKDLESAATEFLRQVIDMILRLIETAPPEMTKDLKEEGMLLVGGFAATPGLADILEERFRFPVVTVEDPAYTSIYGTRVILDDYAYYKKGME